MIFQRKIVVLVAAAQSVSSFVPHSSIRSQGQICTTSFIANNNDKNVAFVSGKTKIFADQVDEAVAPEGEAQEVIPEEAAASEEEVAAPEEEADVEAAPEGETVETEATADEGGEEESSEETAQEPEEELHTAYIGNLPFELEEEEITSLFEPYGAITKVVIPPDRFTGKSRGFAFVSLSSNEEVEKACEGIAGTVLNGRTVYINKSIPREKQERRPRQYDDDEEGTKLYVGNIAFETSTEDLVEYLSQFGEVVDTYVPTDRETGRPRGFAFITMSDEDAVKAIEGADQQQFMGRRLTVNKSLPRGQKREQRQRREQVKLYVGNLSFRTELDSLRGLFEEYGEIYDMYMPTDRDTGRSRGFAFVTMHPDDAVRAADETDGYEMDGRILRVNEAQPKGYSSASSAYGGGYDDGASDGDWGNTDDSWGNDDY